MSKSRELVESLARKLLVKVTEADPFSQPPIKGPGPEPEATQDPEIERTAPWGNPHDPRPDPSYPDPEDEERDPELSFQETLREILDDTGEFRRISTFEEAGLLTRNRGLLVRTKSGEAFQVSIVHDTRH